QFSGPMGPPQSLMNQKVITASSEDVSVEIPMRMIFACTNLGLIPNFAAPMDVPRHLRISGLGRWVRLGAAFAGVYRSNRLSLFSITGCAGKNSLWIFPKDRLRAVAGLLRRERRGGKTLYAAEVGAFRRRRGLLGWSSNNRCARYGTSPWRYSISRDDGQRPPRGSI